MQMDANDPNRADDALATALGRFEQLTIVLPQGGLNVDAPPFVPQEVKRCTYCLGVWPAFMFSKTQWNVRKLRARWRREHEQTASDELKEIFAAFDADGEPFLWRRCNNCRETNKCLRGVLGLEKKTVFAPNLSFLDDNDGNEGVTSGDERGRASVHQMVPAPPGPMRAQLRMQRMEPAQPVQMPAQPFEQRVVPALRAPMPAHLFEQCMVLAPTGPVAAQPFAQCGVPAPPGLMPAQPFVPCMWPHTSMDAGIAPNHIHNHIVKTNARQRRRMRRGLPPT